MSTITLRRLRPDDSIDELTAMLRRAFARLGASGRNCTCVDQTPDITRQRIGEGDCLVALSGRRIVSTVTLQNADPQAEIPWYQHGWARTPTSRCRRASSMAYSVSSR